MKEISQLALLGLMAIILAACSNNEPQPLLKIGSNQWIGYQPMFLARDLGLYDKKQVKLVELPSTTDILHFLHTGELDAAALTLDETLLAIDQGTPLSVILVFDFSNGADALIVKPSIKHLQDLKGKRVGVESTAVGSIMIYSALKLAKLNTEDIHIVYLPADEHLSAYQSGKVDAIVTFEPLRTQLLKKRCKELFTSSMIPGLIVDVLAVRTELLENQRVNIQALVDGYYKARHYMAINEKDAMQRMALGLSITPIELQASFKGLKLPTLAETKVSFSDTPSSFDNTAHRVLKVLKDTGGIGASLNFKSLKNNTFLNAVQP
ncbi:MAG: nitrate ABC transporter [Proteobacteria bacterium]|nr:MAG: nitrate ABC transporter [Pseudomonadota bacterium]